jgi:hypothetical protein
MLLKTLLNPGRCGTILRQMPITERAEHIRVDLSPKNSFSLSFAANGKSRTLAVEEPLNFASGSEKEAQDLLRTVLLAHLIGKHMPKSIETNFPVESTIFLEELYKHYGYKKPLIVKGKHQVSPVTLPPTEKVGQMSYANAHSGGLDSLYRLAKYRFENKSVFATHLRNLNPKGNFREALASRIQAESLGVHYEEIRLRNGSDSTGYDTMKTRDFLLALVAAVNAEKFGVKKVIIEGGQDNLQETQFSEHKPALDFFNKLIRDVGIASQIEGVGGKDIETIGLVLDMEKKYGVTLLGLVQNCFSAPFQTENNRRKWEKNTPVLAENSSVHWCGSCLKCRRMSLGRLYYRDSGLQRVSGAEVDFFVKDTFRWMQKYPHNKDLISESFMNHLEGLSDYPNS